VQNNFLIVIILFAYLKEKWQKNEFFKRLKFNTLIWILTTMIIYFVFLFPLWSRSFFSESEDESVFFSELKTWEKIISLVCSFFLHLFSPMFYIFIYYLYDEHEFMLNKRVVEFQWKVYNNFKFWVYPLLYFLLCIFISNINFYYLSDNGDVEPKPAIWYPFFRQDWTVIIYFLIGFWVLIHSLTILVYFVSKKTNVQKKRKKILN
jgi:hypothetical protein